MLSDGEEAARPPFRMALAEALRLSAVVGECDGGRHGSRL